MIEKIQALVQKGARVPNPESVEIGADVDPDRVSGDGVVIHAGCKLFGAKTLILAGARLGFEGPVTVENCFIGPDVALRGGYFRDAVFLAKASCGSGSQVREGTILEEEASIAHTVGLKHTILFPYVTLGSLINFCDCLMAGGTGRRDHSEVGSSYIHFNFTPNQDKATPSLIGDVPRGVMLRERPIFLGGQGGLVGPVRLSYGLTVAAGTIVRKDEPRPDRLIFGGAGKGGNIEFRPGGFQASGRVIKNNLFYIGNLVALGQWYREVRSLFIGRRFTQALLDGLVSNQEAALAERVRRLKEFSEKSAAAGHKALHERWPAVEAAILSRSEDKGSSGLREPFQEMVSSVIASKGKDYLAAIQALSTEAAGQGRLWLQGIVDETVAGAMEALGREKP
jgi:UDP-N-acetylglucosamine/UDP-N-acetylgalactosamine diphosphorylase